MKFSYTDGVGFSPDVKTLFSLNLSIYIYCFIFIFTFRREFIQTQDLVLFPLCLNEKEFLYSFYNLFIFLGGEVEVSYPLQNVLSNNVTF